MQISISKNSKISSIIFLIFFSLASIGTILHEFGHYIPAKFFGFEPVLHYGSTSYNSTLDFPIFKKVIVVLCGPLINMSIGTCGFFILCRSDRRKYYDIFAIIFTSITFFWSRQVVAFISDVIAPIFNKDIFINNLSDEEKLSLLLNLPRQSVSMIFGIIGISICYYSVFFLIQNKLRVKFIFFGLLGSILGIYIWYMVLGPVLLP
jgi:hypothetical protein